eukprot:gnl/MRDRNA2_/MRDRNA2_28296_c0_seq1.p1 gnl/MRDRNA2_/MRDRNA2_28296_c0~~gnl/MRDRNA2_/MRDRNA2_28296_c0_seq1.p1  ORF type:complete len:336 (-),score=74.61 gnl/MRDRNA2_/MRDRNA2_28296_c0_seq1:33-1040(-)
MTTESVLLYLQLYFLLVASSDGVGGEPDPKSNGLKTSLMRSKSLEITAGGRPSGMMESLITSSAGAQWTPQVPATGCIEKVASGWGRAEAGECSAPVEHWCSWLRVKSNCTSSSLCKWTENQRCQASVKEPYSSGKMVDMWITAQPFCASIKEDRCEDAQELCQSGLVEAYGGFNYCVPKVLRSNSMLTEDEAWSFCSELKEKKCIKSARCHWGEHATVEGWVGCQPVTKSQYEIMLAEIKKIKEKNLNLQRQLQSAKGDSGKSSDCDVMGTERLPKGTGNGLHFRCKSGYCISYADRCNGFKNCGDGSDEEGCDKGTWESAWKRWPLEANLMPQ